MTDPGDEHTEEPMNRDIVDKLRTRASKMMSRGEFTIFTQKEVLEVARHIEDLETRLRRATERSVAEAIYKGEG